MSRCSVAGFARIQLAGARSAEFWRIQLRDRSREKFAQFSLPVSNDVGILLFHVRLSQGGTIMSGQRICPDCDSSSEVTRRDFLKTAGAAALAAGVAPTLAYADFTPAKDLTPETVVKLLYESMSDR